MSGDERPGHGGPRTAAAAPARARRASLGPPRVDGDGLLHYDERWVALGPIEADLARVLVERVGELAPLEDLEAAAWPAPPARGTVRMRVLHLRRHLEQVGLQLRSVRARGYVLEVIGWGAARGWRNGAGQLPWADTGPVGAA